MPIPRKIRWLDAPQPENYPAALAYLTLIFEAKRAKALVKQLGGEDVIEFKAKDIFRASGLSLLGVSNAHVERDLRKIRAGKALSPLLLVRVPGIAKVVVADGYHRLCSVYQMDHEAPIPCKIV
jgi:hypothetical protein